MARSKFSASNAERVMACPGSVNLDLAIPGWTPPVEDPTKFKAKGLGTLLHELMEPYAEASEELLREWAAILDAIADLHYTVRNMILTDSHEFGQRLVLHVNAASTAVSTGTQHTLLVKLLDTIPPRLQGVAPKYIRYLADAARHVAQIKSVPSGASSAYYSELTMDTTWLQQPGKTTVDFVQVDYIGRQLSILDYKTGSIPVTSDENPQLLFYATSVIQQFDLASQIDTVYLHIAQPANFQYAVYDTQYVLDWRAKAQRGEQAILDESVRLTPGDHCIFCPANPYARAERGYPHCPAMRQMLFPDISDYNEILT